MQQPQSLLLHDTCSEAQNTGTLTTTLFAENGAPGPADLLDGSFIFQDVLDFAESGFDPFANLVAGQKTGALSLIFDTSTLGTFSDTIILEGTGHNESDYRAPIGDITLLVTGVVVEQPSPVPEPSTMLLIGTGLVGLAGLRRKFKRTLQRQ